MVHRRSSASTNGVFPSFYLMKTFRVNVVLSVLMFIVFTLHCKGHIVKGSIRRQQEHKHITIWGLIHSKNWYLISTVFFSLKKKQQHGRKANDLTEVISQGRRNAIKG